LTLTIPTYRALYGYLQRDMSAMIRSFARPLISQLQTKKDLQRARESSAVVFVGMYDQSPASDAAIEVRGMCVNGGRY
jgi:hypothetical protein